MEKAASPRILCHCLSLMAELVGFLILDSILIWISRLRKLSFRFLTYSSSTQTGEWKKNPLNEAKQGQELTREDVEMVMERMALPLSHGSEKLDEYMGLDGISSIFEGKEPSMEEVKEAFCIFDDNCDGFIEPVELQRVLCKLGFPQGVDLDACQLMIEKYDENKDGKIDFNEFVKFMESSFCC